MVSYVPIHEREKVRIPLPDIPDFLHDIGTNWALLKRGDYLRPATSYLTKDGENELQGYVVGCWKDDKLMHVVSTYPLPWETCVERCEMLVEWLSNNPEGPNQIERLKWAQEGNKILRGEE